MGSARNTQSSCQLTQLTKTLSSSSEIIAITGATGFVGRKITRLLVSQGWRVKILARSPRKSKQFDDIAVEIVFGSLDNKESLDELVTNADAVIHCAGTVRGTELADFKTANIDGVLNIVNALKRCNNQSRLLLISSLAARMPSLSNYAHSKQQGEKVLTDFHNQLDWTILRPAAIYGDGDREMKPLLDLLRIGVSLQLSDSDSRFSLIHVDDVAQAIFQWVKNRSAKHDIIELDDQSPNGYNWQDISTIASHVFKRPMHRIYIPSFILHSLAVISEFIAKLLRYNPMLTSGKTRELVWHDWVCQLDPQSQIEHWQPELQFEQGLKKLYSRQ